jgi:hypothetical protein
VTEEPPSTDATEEKAALPPPGETAATPAPPPPEPTAAPAPPPVEPALPPPPPPALEGVTQPVGAPPTLVERHPEVLVGAAFLGGVVLATLIRRRGN